MAAETVRQDPPSVRWIQGAMRWMAGHRARTLGGVAVLVLLIFGVQAVYTVDNGESAAVLRFGRLVDDAVTSGIHLRLPAGIERVDKARTGEVFRLEVQGDFVPELALLSADENLIDATLVVQYRIHRLGEYLFATEGAETLIGHTVRAALVETFAGLGVDELLTSAKAAIQNRVRTEAQKRLDLYRAGVTLVAINLQTVNPPFEAAAAFRAVSDSRAEAAQLVSQAEGEQEKSLRLARGEAGQILHQVEAEAQARVSEAAGAAERFEHLLVRSRQAPGQVRAELYAATMQRVLPRARLVILAPGEVPQIDVQLIQPPRAAKLPPPVAGEEP